MYPRLYASPTYCPNGGLDIEILSAKFNSLEDAVAIAKETKIALREQNWFVFKCSSFLFGSKRISLKSLYDLGLFSKSISVDDFGSYYNYK